jgi:hypothetical protein
MIFLPSLVDDGDTDSAGDNDPSVQDDTIHNGDIQHAPPPPQVPPAVPALTPPLDILDIFHRTSCYDLKSLFQHTETLQRIHVHVPSKRTGGEARRQLLKQRAAKIPRSVCEAFAFSTSQTISEEDTAAVLETFGSVRYPHVQLQDY